MQRRSVSLCSLRHVKAVCCFVLETRQGCVLLCFGDMLNAKGVLLGRSSTPRRSNVLSFIIVGTEQVFVLRKNNVPALIGIGCCSLAALLANLLLCNLQYLGQYLRYGILNCACQ